MLREDARRVPVVDGRLEGLVTITDVVRAIAEGDANGEVTVGELATDQINCVYVETPLPVAGRELSHAEVAYGVGLDDDGDACGMLTEVDILDVAEIVEGEEDAGESLAGEDDEWMWEGIKAVGSRYLPTRNVEIPAEPVRVYMTADLVTISRRRTARDAAQLLLSNDIEQLPMMAGDDLVGIVLDMDLLEALT
jgi:IMP dehydrogenase